MTKPPSPRPLSIKVIASIYLLGVLAGLTSRRKKHLVFGILVEGHDLMIYHLIVSLLLLFLGTGLWQLRERARREAMIFQGLALIDTSLNYFSNVGRILQWATQNSADPSFALVRLSLGGLRNLALHGLMLWFLMKRKSAFVKPAKSP